MNQTIYSERLILRKFEESDINDIYKIFSDKDTNRFLPWFPLEKLRTPDFFIRSAALKFIALTADMPTPCALKRTTCL